MWFKNLLLTLITLSMFLPILLIGKKREPYTANTALASALVNFILILGILKYWQ